MRTSSRLRHRRAIPGIVAVTAVALLGPAGTAVAASGSPAAAQTTATVTLAGALPLTTAPVRIVVEVQVASDFGPHAVPRKLTDVPLSTAVLPAGSPSYSIPVPASATLTAAVRQGHGYANLIVAAYSGGKSTQEYQPAPISKSASPGNLAVQTMLGQRLVHVPRLGAMQAASTAVPYRPMTSSPAFTPRTGANTKASPASARCT